MHKTTEKGAGLATRHNIPGVLPRALFLLLGFAAAVSCASQRKLSDLRSEQMTASLQLPAKQESFIPEVSAGRVPVRDTLRVTDLEGKEVLIMRAIRDDESGEMVATEQLDAAVVTARFRNVAERHGRVDLEFQVVVPRSMQDSRWQLRLHPDMFVLQDSVRLDDVIITGAEYRKAQLRGYQQYQRFLDRIITDTTLLIDRRNLEIFLERNIPELWALRQDSTFVSDEEFESCFGVSGSEAVDHYTWGFLVRRNNRLKAAREKMWRRYIKAPIVTDGIRLDTVIRTAGGDFIYNYVQTISTRPKLRKADIVLSGAIFEQDKQLYTVPRSAPLTFYISSVSAFVDGRERYLTKVISRDVAVGAECIIDFKAGRWDIDGSLGRNEAEMDRIKRNLRDLLTNETFELDSIGIVASASPEGGWASNSRLCLQRARSASDYFGRYLDFVRDSLRREAGLFVTVGDDLTESSMHSASARRDISFRSRSGGENWDLLGRLVAADSLISDSDREAYEALEGIADPDEREKTLQKLRCYRHIREDLYPRLRTVKFNFALHRRGMVKDTVHTTVLDSLYMKGVELVRDHQYEEALAILGPYQDYNTAVACVALDRNLTAMNILKECEQSPQVNYMMALLHSRAGEDREAVECYIRACQQDPSLVFRGNLDPEIAALIKKYNLNQQNDE